jgi:hypothetical protein
MALPNRSEGDVYTHARSCEEKFKTLCRLEKESGESWADDLRARFRIWGVNLGVFASGQASFDNRLKEFPEVAQVIIQLLKALLANLIHCKTPWFFSLLASRM